MKTRWHILTEGQTLVLARRLPVRMDVSAETALPDANRLKIAQQVRQDMWRALQKLRGFAPVVAVTRTADGLHVRAGGQVDGAVPASAVATVQGVLDDPRKRSRWVRHATRKPSISSDADRAGPRSGADAGRDVDLGSISITGEKDRSDEKRSDRNSDLLEDVQGRGHG